MRYVLLALLLLGSLAVVERGAVPCDVVQAQPACYVTMRPGPTRDVLTLTTIEGVEPVTEESQDGELLLTTVRIQDNLTWREWLRNQIDDQVINLDRELIYPSDVTREDVNEQNAAAMDTSELDATIAGLEAAGLDLDEAFEGAEVVNVRTDGAVDDGQLVVGDVITAVNGVEVSTSADAVQEVRRVPVGGELVLTVTRDGQSLDVPLVAAPNPSDPALPYVGVELGTKIELPLEVEIDAGAIGGPSAGLMFALGIVDLLDARDFTGGRVIAGTGTIDAAGIVGPIGGIQQKIVAAAALDRPAALFLVPRANFVEARAAAVDREIVIVPVDNLQDAIRVVTTYEDGVLPDEGVALAP